MREPLAPPARAKATDATQPDGPWLEAGRGLGLYAAALSARLGLTVFLYLLMLLAVQTRAAGILTLASVVLSIATVTTGLVMLAGLARFARQPIGARSRSSARFAATVFGAAVLLDPHIPFAGQTLQDLTEGRAGKLILRRKRGLIKVRARRQRLRQDAGAESFEAGLFSVLSHDVHLVYKMCT